MGTKLYPLLAPILALTSQSMVVDACHLRSSSAFSSHSLTLSLLLLPLSLLLLPLPLLLLPLSLLPLPLPIFLSVPFTSCSWRIFCSWLPHSSRYFSTPAIVSSVSVPCWFSLTLFRSSHLFFTPLHPTPHHFFILLRRLKSGC